MKPIRSSAFLLLLLACVLPACTPKDTAPDPASDEAIPWAFSVQVTAAAFSPDNKRLLIAYSPDPPGGFLKVRDIEANHHLRTFPGHTSGIAWVAYLPDSKRALSTGADEPLKLWNTTTGKLLSTLGEKISDIPRAAVSREGTKVFVWSRDLWLWDVHQGKELTTRKASRPWQLGPMVFSPDATAALGFDNDAITLWDLSTQKTLRQLEGSKEAKPPLALSPDGKMAVARASAANWDQPSNLLLWDVATGKLVRRLPGHTFWIQAVTFLPDGKHVASGGTDRTIRVWDLATGQEVRAIAVGYEMRCLAFSPDGTLALAVSRLGQPPAGTANLTFNIWDLTTGKLVQSWLENGYGIPIEV